MQACIALCCRTGWSQVLRTGCCLILHHVNIRTVENEYLGLNLHLVFMFFSMEIFTVFHAITTALHQWHPRRGLWCRGEPCHPLWGDLCSGISASYYSSDKQKRALRTCPLWQTCEKTLMFCKLKARRQLHKYQSGQSVFCDGAC